MAPVQSKPVAARSLRGQLRRPVPKALRGPAPAKGNRAASKKTPVSAPDRSANPPANSNNPDNDAMDIADDDDDSDDEGNYQADDNARVNKPRAGPSTGGRQAGAATYTTTELNLLLDTVATILPRCSKDWEEVARSYNEDVGEGRQRALHNLRVKFNRVCFCLSCCSTGANYTFNHWNSCSR